MINEFLFFGGNRAASQFPNQKKSLNTVKEKKNTRYVSVLKFNDLMAYIRMLSSFEWIRDMKMHTSYNLENAVSCQEKVCCYVFL